MLLIVPRRRHPTLPARFGEAVREARRARGLSQAQLAELMGVHPDRIRRVEAGRSEPALSLVARLAPFLGISLDRLLLQPSVAS